METLYIDVYFLINFSVDILSLHFAAAFAKVPLSKTRLIILSVILSVLASLIIIFTDSLLVTVIANLLVVILVIGISSGRVGMLKRVKLTCAFYALMTLIGGITTLIFNLVNKYFPHEEYGTEVNRGILMFAITVLLAYGIIKMLLSLFSGSTSERYVELELELLGNVIHFYALVDSGNLLRDPIDATPVMLIKEKKVRELFPGGVPQLNITVPEPLKGHVRLIPIKEKEGSRIEYGLMPRAVYVCNGKRKYKLRLIFLIDYAEGSFGGYDGLIGTSGLEGII